MMASLMNIFVTVCTVILAVPAFWRWRASGWGALVWLAAFVAMTMIRAPHALRARKNVVVATRMDMTEKLLLAAVFLTMMVLPLLHLATRVFGFASYWLPAWATAVGAAVQLPFLWLFWRSHADLGRNWSLSLEVREDHGLVTGGVYTWIRHPMYAAIWLSALSQPLLIHNWIGGALVIPAFAAMWFIRVPREEALMRERFGREYDSYCAETRRLLPSVFR